MVLLVGVGTKSFTATIFPDQPDIAKTEEQLLEDPETLRSLLSGLLSKDAYLQEKAPKLKVCLDIDSSQLERCDNSADVNEAKTELDNALNDIKTLVTALRRSMKDCGS